MFLLVVDLAHVVVREVYVPNTRVASSLTVYYCYSTLGVEVSISLVLPRSSLIGHNKSTTVTCVLHVLWMRTD